MKAMAEQKTQNRPKLVRDAMQHQVIGVVPEMTVRELIQLLLENGITGAPVLDPRGKVAGVVSVTDVLQLAARKAEIPAGRLACDPVLIAEEVGEEDSSDGAASGTEVLAQFTRRASHAVAEAAFDQFQVRDIMTPVAFSIGPKDPIEAAARFMLKGHIHRVLVMEDGVLFGIITPFDLLQAIEWE